PGLRDFEHSAFGLVQHLCRGLSCGAEGGIRDLGPDRGEASHDGALAHDLAVTADVRGARRVRSQGSEVGLPPAVRQPSAPLQALGHGERVGRLAVLDQIADVLEDDAVIGAVEILPRYEIGYPVPGTIVEQQSAEYRLLGFDRLGWNARRFDLRVLEDRSDDL